MALSSSRKKLIIGILILGFVIEAILYFTLPQETIVNIEGTAYGQLMRLIAFKGVAIFFISLVLAILLEGFNFRKKVLNSKKILGLFIAIYIITFTSLTVMDYSAFNVPTPDLVIFNQSMWNTLHGNFMESNYVGGNYFEDHFAPLLLLLIPVYAIFPQPPMLLFLQTILLALGAIPVFLLAQKIIGSDKAGLVFAACYLLYPPLQFINLQEFHAISLAVPLLLAMFYFLYIKKYNFFWFFYFLSIMANEMVSLVLAFLGIYIIAIQKNLKLGLTVFAFSALWFILVLGAVIPYFAGTEYTYAFGPQGYFNHLGNNLGEAIQNTILNPINLLINIISLQKIGYLILLLLPAGFLSILNLPSLLIAAPTLGINLLASPARFATIYFHYNATIIAFVLISAVFGARKAIEYGKENQLCLKFGITNPRRIILLLVLFSGLLSSMFLGPSPISLLNPLPDQTNFEFSDYTITQHHAIIWKAIAMIPGDAAVSSEWKMMSQLSSRKNIDYFPQSYLVSDYLLLDTTIETHASHAESKVLVEELKAGNEYELIFEEDGVLLFKKV